MDDNKKILNLDQDSDCEWTIEIEEKNNYRHFEFVVHDFRMTNGCGGIDYSFESLDEKRNFGNVSISNFHS